MGYCYASFTANGAIQSFLYVDAVIEDKPIVVNNVEKLLDELPIVRHKAPTVPVQRGVRPIVWPPESEESEAIKKPWLIRLQHGTLFVISSSLNLLLSNSVVHFAEAPEWW